MLVVGGPVLIEVGHSLRRGMDRRAWFDCSRRRHRPTFDWWWFGPAVHYLGDEDPFGDIMMAPRSFTGWTRAPPSAQIRGVSGHDDERLGSTLDDLGGLGRGFTWRSDAKRRIAVLDVHSVCLFELDDPKVQLVHRARRSRLALIAALGLRGVPFIGRRLLGVATVAGLVVVLARRRITCVGRCPNGWMPVPQHGDHARGGAAQDARGEGDHLGGAVVRTLDRVHGGWKTAAARLVLRRSVLGLGLQVRGRNAAA